MNLNLTIDILIMGKSNKYNRLLLLLLVGVFFINGCSDSSLTANDNNKYQVNLSADPSEGGEVSPEFGKYESGSELEITATPSEGYRFENWTGDYEGTSKNATITVDEPKSITANFVRKSYELTVDTTGKGSVDESVLQSKSYEGGTEVELTANPATGWMFDHWEGDLSGSENPETITVDGPKQVTAVFTKTEYELTINAENGAVKQEVVQSKSYDPGTVVKLTANPNEGFTFDHWEDDLSGSENPETIVMDGPKTVTAIFKGKTYTINITTQGNGNGSVSKDPDQAEYEAGTIVTLTAEPGEGQQFSEWTGDVPGGSSTDNPLAYTVSSSNDITAVFKTATEGEPTGSGTEEDPYIITSYSNLKWVSATDSVWSASFKQTLDIDASASETENSGKGFSPIGNFGTKFSGHYNGNGHEISNLFINRPNDANIGFIGVTNGAVIENVRLVNASITAQRVVGAIVGRNKVGSIIRDTYASGKVVGGDATGGLVGNNKINCEIIRSFSAVDVQEATQGSRFIGGIAGVNLHIIKQSFATGNISGTKVIGGLVGNHKGKVMNSYATGKVSGKENFVGGLVGANNGEVATSYSVGEVTTEADPADYKPGGLSGGKNPDAITNSYFDTETAGDVEAKGATRLKTSQMQGTSAKDNMEGFDFAEVWETNPSAYPTLRNNPPPAN